MQSTESRTAAGRMKEIKCRLGGGWKLTVAQGSQDEVLPGWWLPEAQRPQDKEVEGILRAV